MAFVLIAVAVVVDVSCSPTQRRHLLSVPLRPEAEKQEEGEVVVEEKQEEEEEEEVVVEEKQE